jgi:hypothetical protein
MAQWESSRIVANESNVFITQKEKDDLFGNEIKPDRMKIPSAQILRESAANP